ncbi:MAG TPA: N-acetyltransferase [Bacillota bacterium]|nr:N-acetyltransferase [Bacillota bacterium]
MFCDAFEDSWRVYGFSEPPVAAAKDLFYMCWRSQPGFFFIFEEEGLLLGYLIAPLSMRKLVIDSLINGSAIRLAFRFLSGQYGIRFKDALKASIGASSNLFLRRKGLPSCDSRILSIGVSKSAQGKGIGRKLMLKGLQALDGGGASKVRLEVRRDNRPAHHLYCDLGFADAGVIESPTGPWVVMVRKHHE